MIGDLLRTPEAQADAHHWAATLLAHAFIGVALAAVMPWWLALALYAAWEAVQWHRYGAGLADCVLDWSAVALGVCVAVALSQGHSAIGAALSLFIVALVGARRRM